MERISEISGTIGSGGSFYSADSWHKDMKFNPSIKPTMNEISDSPHQPMKTNTNLQDKVNSKLEISGFQGMGKRKGSNKSFMGGNNQFKSLLCDWTTPLAIEFVFFSRHFNYIDCQTSALSTSSVSLFHDSGS